MHLPRRRASRGLAAPSRPTASRERDSRLREAPGSAKNGTSMQVTTLSLFRFRGPWNKFWAFMHMGLAPAAITRLPGSGFLKMLGVGRDAAFHPAPNFGIYAILATWDGLDDARSALEGSDIFRRYRAHADEHWSVYLTATRSKGSWDAAEPFEPNGARGRGPVGILTRASIDRRKLIPFWRSVPAVSEMVPEGAPLRFRIGMGEKPVVQLMTFSIWDDLEAAHAFAYRDGAHLETMRHARKDDWFSEDLFVRFAILDAQGTWEGARPLDGLPLGVA